MAVYGDSTNRRKIEELEKNLPNIEFKNVDLAIAGSSTERYELTFTKTYSALPSVNVDILTSTADDNARNYRVWVEQLTLTGCKIAFYNGRSTAVTPSITISVIGK